MNAPYAAIVSVLCLSRACIAQPGGLGEPDANGFWWSTIGSVGNAPLKRDFKHNRFIGRGQVNYEYRISRFEMRTEQWIDFVNTFSTQSDDLRYFAEPVLWGAEADPTYKGPGIRWQLRDTPDAAWLPVTGFTWRDAALYANWLHNDRSSELSSLETGAYDTSTWGRQGERFTDDHTHLPGARFWIPTLDEFFKAGYYDPDANGGEGAWWLHPNGSDDPYVAGLPPAWGGDGQTSAGDLLPGFDELRLIPLGAYPDSQTPWGLFDVSGGGREWVEEVIWPDYPVERVVFGSSAGANTWGDQIGAAGSWEPYMPYPTAGFRLVSMIPAPGWGGVLVVWVLFHERKRRV